MIDFPNNPAVDSTFLAPNGVTYKWNGTTWVAVATSGAVPEAPRDGKSYVRINGTWADANLTFVADAGDKLTGPLGFVDGTVALPGIAWAGNMASGWSRPAAGGSRLYSVNGAQVETLGTGSGTVAQLSLNPPATGSSNFSAADAAYGAVNYNGVSWGIDASGPYIQEFFAGTGASKALRVNVGAGMNVVGQLTAQAGIYVKMGSATDGTFQFVADTRYRYMSFGTGWGWMWDGQNGNLTWLGNGAGRMTLDGSGNLTATGTLRANQDIAASGGLYGGTVVYAPPGNGYQFSPGYASDGGGGMYCTIAYGSPNYGNFAERFWHQSGQWVGWQVTSNDGKTIRWSGQSGECKADSFVPWSDSRMKTNIQPILDARTKVAALTGVIYESLTGKNYDGTPYVDAGLIAQDVLPVLPEAVKLSMLPQPMLADGTPDPTVQESRYGLNYNGIIALLVNDNNAMAARIDSLLAKLSALESIPQPMFEYTFNRTNVAPPAGQQFRTDFDTWPAVTKIWIDNHDLTGVDRRPFLLADKAGSVFYIQDENDSTLWATFDLLANAVGTDPNYVELSVRYRGSNGVMVGNNRCVIGVQIAGSIGV